MPPQSCPAGVLRSSDDQVDIDRVVSAVADAKRVVVVCGAGVSVSAGIPDFRSDQGVFKTLKRDNPKLASGKDLFNADVFKAPATTELFNTMIGGLAGQAAHAQPTAFHRLLKALDDRGKLLRVYTQNIDCLEERAGLSYGIPSWKDRRRSPAKSKGKPVIAAATSESGLLTPPDNSERNSPSANSNTAPSAASASASPASATETPAVAAPVAPRCIPLHGHVKTLYCPRCFQTTALQPYLDRISNGESIRCSSCEELDNTRRLIGKRERGVGHLRPSVVLYGEQHREGEVIGECVRRDLLGIQGPSWMSHADDVPPRKGKTKGPASSSKSKRKPDLLIVAGTSLKVPGTKSIVRQFSNAVRASAMVDEGSSTENSDEEEHIRTLFVNLDFPVPSREWNGVFDYWLQGDIQIFSDLIKREFDQRDEETRLKEGRKALRASKKLERELLANGSSTTSTASASGKRKPGDTYPKTPPKRRRADEETAGLPTPPPSVGRAIPARAHSQSQEPPVSTWLGPGSSSLVGRSVTGPVSLLHPTAVVVEDHPPPRSHRTSISRSSRGFPTSSFYVEVPSLRHAERS